MRLNLMKFFTIISVPRPFKIKYRRDGINYSATAIEFNEDYLIIKSGVHKGQLVHRLELTK